MDEYDRQADAAGRRALEASNPHDREQWERIAEQWRSLARVARGRGPGGVRC